MTQSLYINYIIDKSEIWPCVGTQVKDGPHVIIWTACKRTYNQYETSCGFRPHPRECLYANSNIKQPLYKALCTNTNNG